MYFTTIATWVLAAAQCSGFTLFPANKATNVNPDTHLVITFCSPPKVGTSGLIRIYDGATQQLVDTLDLSIAVSPAPSGRAIGADGSTTSPGPADPDDKTPYQNNIIGGIDFHFFPIIVRNNQAMIYPHNNKLKYGKTYYVTVAPSVLRPDGETFAGLTTNTAWTFSTKAKAPTANATRVVVAEDGSGDFNTVQGAFDFLPAQSARRRTISIKNGNYTEIVFAQNKTQITIRGESRTNVTVGYPNNSAFNPSKGGPSRRPAFSMISCNDMQLSTFTVKNYFIGQAEAVLAQGDRIIFDRMDVRGSGDAFTTRGTIYFADSLLTGDGDTVLGYAAVYFLRSEIQSVGPFTWTRTPKGSHGNIFVNSTLIGIQEPLPWSVTEANPEGQIPRAVFTRLPQNGDDPAAPGYNFPYAEMVLINTKTSGVPAEGWGPIQGEGFDKTNVHLWEYNTMDLQGRPVDLSRRDPAAKQLSLPQDAKTVADYSSPEFVLGGWKPVVLQDEVSMCS